MGKKLVRNMSWKDEIRKEEIKKYSRKAQIKQAKRMVENVHRLFDGLEKKGGFYDRQGKKLGVGYAINFLPSVIKILDETYDEMEYPPEDEESESDKHDAEVMRRLREGGDYHEARVNLGSRR
tara:strand:+ start:36 stop:404 length:369 start_codon:yes stop_codon:yes gene_type:complete